MKSRPHRSTIVALAAVALLAFPAVASSAIDYSKNAATGDYAHGPLPPSGLAKDYSKNGATGDYAHGPLPPSGLAKDYSKNEATGDYAPADTPSVQVVTVADNGGFAWGDAAIGAGVTLALALIALGATTVIRRRRITSLAT
jgi:hypothetical protein